MSEKFGKLDIKASTVEVKAYVIPKEYQPDVTQAFFLCGDEEVAAEYSEGKYEVTMNVPLFENVNIPSVLFSHREFIRTRLDTLKYPQLLRYHHSVYVQYTSIFCLALADIS